MADARCFLCLLQSQLAEEITFETLKKAIGETNYKTRRLISPAPSVLSSNRSPPFVQIPPAWRSRSERGGVR